MMTVRVEGYLLQQKLEEALKTIVGPSAWRGREVPVGGPGRRRWDMSYEEEERLVVVEFDGDEHYRNALKIKADQEKDELAMQRGHAVVRFPYWVQLTSTTLKHYFGLAARVEQTFPHGFIATKIFPASFCELGVVRFARELMQLPQPVREDVVGSLADRAIEHGVQYVLPAKLTHLISK